MKATTKALICSIAATAAIATAEARRGGGGNGGGGNRPETITCSLNFKGQPAKAVQSGVVQNAQVLLRGEADGVAYAFSVRGKTAVARLTISETQQVITAQGAIEMLRHGGEVRPAPLNDRTPFRRGEDDANDGTPEREAGFQLSAALTSNPNDVLVSLKCESVNQP